MKTAVQRFVFLSLHRSVLALRAVLELRARGTGLYWFSNVLLAWANIFRFQWPRRRSSFMGCCALRQLKWHFWVRSTQSNSSVDVIQIVHWWCGHIPELCSKRTALNYEFCPFCYERQNGSINQYVCCKCNVTIIGLRFIDKINNLLASLSKLSIIPHTGYSTKLKQLQFYTT